MPYIETKINGETIQFELPSYSLSGEQPTGLVGDTINKLGKNISEEIIKKIHAVVKLVMEAKESFNEAPAEIAIEFGLSVDTKADIYITSGTVSSNIKIAFKWVG